MDNNKIYLKTESSINTNRISKFYSLMSNLKQKKNKINNKFDYSRLNQNILMNIIKKSSIRKLHHKSRTHTKLEFFHKNRNFWKTEFRTTYNLNKKFHDLPSLSRFHNITSEKINKLIKSTDINETNNTSNSIKPCKFLSNKTRNKKKIENISSDKKRLKIKTSFLNTNNSERKERLYNNRYRTKDSHNLLRNIESKIFAIKLQDLNSNLKGNLYSTKFPISLFKYNSSQIKTDKIKFRNYAYNNKNISNNIKLNKINIDNKRSVNSATKRWIESLKDSIKKYDFTLKVKKDERAAFFNQKSVKNKLNEKSEEDKYLLFKEQILKHKNKFEQIIRKIKMKQINKEHLMKKFIFELKTKKKLVN